MAEQAHGPPTCVLWVACAHHTAYLARASSCQISSSMVAPRLRAHSNACPPAPDAARPLSALARGHPSGRCSEPCASAKLAVWISAGCSQGAQPLVRLCWWCGVGGGAVRTLVSVLAASMYLCISI
jgi:hypothetical protein